MTPLRFRAWMPKWQQMFTGEFLQIAPNGAVVIQGTADGKRYHAVNLLDREPEAVVMMSTGLTDEDGVEIFEGDILDCLDNIVHPDGQHRVTGYVYWDDDAAAFMLRYADPADESAASFEDKLLCAESDYRVRGNIHEHRDLLLHPLPDPPPLLP